MNTGDIKQITLGKEPHLSNNTVSDFVGIQPRLATRTICFRINGSSFDFRGADTNIASVKLIGYEDLGLSGMNVISFNEFWSPGLQIGIYANGSQNYRPIFTTVTSLMTSKPIVLVEWKNADGVLQNTNINFLDSTGNPINLNGILYFEIQKNSWGK